MDSITSEKAIVAVERFSANSTIFFVSFTEIPDGGKRYMDTLSMFTLEYMALACVPSISAVPPRTVDEGIRLLVRHSHEPAGQRACMSFCQQMESLLRDLEHVVDTEIKLRKQNKRLCRTQRRSISDN